MQKKLIALAVASVVSGGAFAQSNVTVYGRIDYALKQSSGDSGGLVNQKSTTSFAEGVQAGSRIGFKGAEDLGNGLKAIFELEYGLAVDESANHVINTAAAATPNANGGSVKFTGTAATWLNRHSYVGLTGGFGTVVGGRLDGVRYNIFNGYDNSLGAANFVQITRQVDRANNAIAYISPNFNGFSFVAAYGTHILGANGTVLGATPGAAAGLTGLNATTTENPGNLGDFKLATFKVDYVNGPMQLTFDVEQVKAKDISGSGALAALGGGLTDKISVMTIGGSYDFGMIKVSGVYDTLKDELTRAGTLQEKHTWFISAKMPFGQWSAKTTYGKSEDQQNSAADVKKFGIGIDYALSKRTTVYADYGKVSNGSASYVGISSSNNAYGPTTNYAGAVPGTVLTGVRMIDIGMSHNF